MTDIAPPDVSRWLPSLRGRFERILCVARSQSAPVIVGNIELADRLIDAVLAEQAANPNPAPEGGPSDEEIYQVYREVHRYRPDVVLNPVVLEEGRALLARYGNRPALPPPPIL